MPKFNVTEGSIFALVALLFTAGVVSYRLIINQDDDMTYAISYLDKDKNVVRKVFTHEQLIAHSEGLVSTAELIEDVLKDIGG